MKDILTLYKSRDLIFNLVSRDIKVKYKSSVLGILWSLLKPLFLMAILTVVFTRFFSKFGGIEIPYPYALHILTGILSWTFVAGALGESVHSIAGHGNLIKKIKINSAAFPVSTVLSNFVHFCIAMIVMFLFLIFYKASIGPLFLLLPIVMILQFFFVVGLSLIFSSLYVFYRDIASIVEVLLMGWFYATPIFYPADIIRQSYGDTAYNIFMLNPQAVILTFFRNTLLLSKGNFFSGFGKDGELGIYYLIYILLFIIVLLVIGSLIYNHYKDSFVDEL